MANIPHKTRRLGYAGDPRVPFAWAGWNDALAGRPLDYYLLDCAPSPVCAHAYETARYRVMALRDAGLPVWSAKRPVILAWIELDSGQLVTSAAPSGWAEMVLDEARHALNPEALTIGFARRFATYKRATLLFSDLDRLRRIITNVDRPVQFIFAGKAHPADHPAKEYIKLVASKLKDPTFGGAIVFRELMAFFRGL